MIASPSSYQRRRVGSGGAAGTTMNPNTDKPLARAICAMTVALSFFFWALPAAATEAAVSEEGGGLFSGDLGGAIWTLAIFLGLLFVLGKFAWTPMLNALQQREDFIHDSLAKAKQERDAADAKLAEYQEILAAARAEATAIADEGRRDAVVLRTKIEDAARAEAEQIIARARREVQLAGENAKKELYALAGEMATRVATKIVGRSLADDDRQRMVAEAIDEIHQLAES